MNNEKRELPLIPDLELLELYARAQVRAWVDEEYFPELHQMEEEILLRMGAAKVVRSIPENLAPNETVRCVLDEGRAVHVTGVQKQYVAVGFPDDFMLRALRAGVVVTMKVIKVDTELGFFLCKEAGSDKEFKFPLPEMGWNGKVVR